MQVAFFLFCLPGGSFTYRLLYRSFLNPARGIWRIFLCVGEQAHVKTAAVGTIVDVNVRARAASWYAANCCPATAVQECKVKNNLHARLIPSIFYSYIISQRGDLTLDAAMIETTLSKPMRNCGTNSPIHAGETSNQLHGFSRTRTPRRVYRYTSSSGGILRGLITRTI